MLYSPFSRCCCNWSILIYYLCSSAFVEEGWCLWSCQRTSYRCGQQWKLKRNGQECIHSRNDVMWLKKLSVQCSVCLWLLHTVREIIYHLLWWMHSKCCNITASLKYYPSLNVLFKRYFSALVQIKSSSIIFLHVTPLQITQGRRFHVLTLMCDKAGNHFGFGK